MQHYELLAILVWVYSSWWRTVHRTENVPFHYFSKIIGIAALNKVFNKSIVRYIC